MEFIWSPYEKELGANKTQIFTHYLYHHYNPPKALNFDSIHQYSYWENNPKNPRFNADEQSTKLDEYISEYKQKFSKHN